MTLFKEASVEVIPGLPDVKVLDLGYSDRTFNNYGDKPALKYMLCP